MNVLENKTFSVLLEHIQSTQSKKWLYYSFRSNWMPSSSFVYSIRSHLVFGTLKTQTIYMLMCFGIQFLAFPSFIFQVIGPIFRLPILPVSLVNILMYLIQAYYTVPNLFGFLYYQKFQWLKYLYLCQLLLPKSDQEKILHNYMKDLSFLIA